MYDTNSTYWNRKKNNLCVWCGASDLRTKRLCGPCGDKASSVMVARYRKRKELHLCIKCGSQLPLEYTLVHCQECSSERNPHNKRYKKGLPINKPCPGCGNQLLDGRRVRCYACAIKLHMSFKERLGAGLCRRCPCQRLKDSENFCHEHYLRALATKFLDDASKWKLLEDKFSKQGGLCAYSGRPLTLGLNASIDHKVPQSKAPELGKSIKNLQWVDWVINHMKSMIDEDEFLLFASDISQFSKIRISEIESDADRSRKLREPRPHYIRARKVQRGGRPPRQTS